MDTESKPDNFKAINILHKALLFAELFFSVIAAYLVYSNTFSSTLQDQDKIFLCVAFIFSVAGYFAGTSIFNNRLAEIRGSDDDLDTKFNKYRAASIMRWAMIEGPCIFSLICFLLTADYKLLILALILIVVLTIIGPSRTKIATQMELDDEEATSL